MLNFYRMPDSSYCIEPITGKTYKELLGDDVNKPRCSQFANFILYGFENDLECPDWIFEKNVILIVILFHYFLYYV